jgi:nucleoside-diphosphate-sugar epimerase
VAGLLQRAPPTPPGHLLHLSGTGILSDWADASALGRLSPHVYSDVTSLATIRSLPASALHRPTEALLHATAAAHPARIRIAIMCPPDIYGRGLGPVKTESALIPLFVRESVAKGAAFFVAPGANTRSWVHIADLMRLYVHVVDAALANDSTAFNEDGYYFASTQEASQRELAERVGAVLAARGKVARKEPVEVEVEELDGLLDYPAFPNLGRYLFASNSRSRAERAGRWGFKGETPGLWEALEGEVERALEAL